MSPFTFYLLLALGLIGTELVVFQFTIFWFLFVGLGALAAMITALILPEATWLVTTAVFVISSGVISAGLYAPLKKWQDKPGKMAGNDAIGQTVSVAEAISASAAGKVIWSGTDWNAELAEGEEESLNKGDTAYIVALEGIRITVSKTKP